MNSHKAIELSDRSKFKKLRHECEVLSPNEEIDFIGDGGRMPDAIYEYLFEYSSANDGLFDFTAWEPFAMDDRSRKWHTNGSLVIHGPNFDLLNGKIETKCVDSTRYGPGKYVHMVIFHPPYYGSSPLSDAGWDISNLDHDDYFEALYRSVVIAYGSLSKDGIVGVVGRDYNYDGEFIRMSEIMVGMFISLHMNVEKVVTFTPDILTILRK
tara:strand:- start:1292 stop:1924 length:633 start_codon:yes stop_codon:yes gene_type:complete